MKHLEIKYTVSRGRDTYGYNIVSLIDVDKKYKASGGGYDMVGTVFADWLEANYHDRLHKLLEIHIGEPDNGFYGLFLRSTGVVLDGACGFDCIKRIAQAIGLEIKTIWKRNHGYTYIIVDDKKGEE